MKPLYQAVRDILEEHVAGQVIDLDTAEGQAKMQTVTALLVTTIYNPHDLELEPE